MKKKLFTNIKSIVGTDHTPFKRGKEMQALATINNGYILVHNGVIARTGQMQDIQLSNFTEAEITDCQNRYILPCYADSHTHLVFATWREQEFLLRLQGKSYEEIAAEGGGILNSAKKLAQISEEELFQSALKRLYEVIRLGTGAIEIKSGYGLSVEGELKMLRVIKRLKELNIIPIKSTFLGAHSFPLEYKNNRQGYIKLIIDEMLPNIAKEGLANYIDVFCENGFYTPNESIQVLEAGKTNGLTPKVHGNQMGLSGGVQVAVSTNALSVDHLEHTSPEEISLLFNSNTYPVLLPTSALFLRNRYPDARTMIDSGLGVVLASDYNPGTTPSGNMSFVNSLACIEMRMLPNEAINASTINGAYSMEVENTVGSISVGKLANFMLMQEIPSLSFIPYRFGNSCIDTVFIKGERM